MTKPMALYAVAIAAVRAVLSVPACAAPPPPPRQANLTSLQAFIRGLNDGKPEEYSVSLAEDVVVYVDVTLVAKSKSEWLSSTGARFINGYNQYVTVESTYYGGAPSPGGAYEERTILLERVDRVFGDCCVYHRVETLTYKSGLISKIERSPELDFQLKPNGHRPDIPNG